MQKNHHDREVKSYKNNERLDNPPMVNSGFFINPMILLYLVVETGPL
ncbi:MAG: hypothetical protein JWP81_2637 [Ferruginibacter sp.]|nr:hypothetical protein [Ferruginibacter sp.]